MNSEEPIRAVEANDQVSTDGKPLPEAASLPIEFMPRQISMLNLMYQWQPMGFRVVLNLPFVGDDRSFLFYIRNGPFIPDPPNVIQCKDFQYDNAPSGINLVSSYIWNNTTPVYLFAYEPRVYPGYEGDKDFPIVLTQYDMPPIISTLARSFRRWRGDMQYRIRVVAGFATQGYIIVTPFKQNFVPIGAYDANKIQPAIHVKDTTYRDKMINSYMLADTSMYRHIEATMPYDYPTSYYDQYAWLSRRVAPGMNFAIQDGKILELGNFIQGEPHGDNFLAVGLRGALAATQVGSQIEFELEYRCMEGFQFADPFIPPTMYTRSTYTTDKQGKSQPTLPYRVPDRSLTSDGIGVVKKVTTSRAARSVEAVSPLLARLSLGTSERNG